MSAPSTTTRACSRSWRRELRRVCDLPSLPRLPGAVLPSASSPHEVAEALCDDLLGGADDAMDHLAGRDDVVDEARDLAGSEDAPLGVSGQTGLLQAGDELPTAFADQPLAANVLL